VEEENNIYFDFNNRNKNSSSTCLTESDFLNQQNPGDYNAEEIFTNLQSCVVPNDNQSSENI
jgi:hypothetical protein